ncbi:MAG: hypothetical protein WCH96_04840 [Betaproteobacteria bacterium]|jgi:Tfp pilus assembly protein PilV
MATPSSRGFSLISLMIGLSLGVIAVLAMMFAYKSLVSNALSFTQSTSLVNQSLTSALVLNRILVPAGYGIGPTLSTPGGAVNTDIVLISGASLSGQSLTGTQVSISASSASGTALVWDSNTSGSIQCSGLIFNSNTLSRLGPEDCTGATQWSSLTWSSSQPLTGSSSFTGITFSVMTTTCWPYMGGTGTTKNGVQVTLNGLSAYTTATTYCLPNIPN